MPMSNSQVRVVDPVLSNIALGYSNPERTGLSLFPRVAVPKRGAKVIKFGKEGFFLYSARRAPGADTKRVMYGHASDPIALVQDALEAQVPREWLQEAQDLPGVDLAGRAVNNVMSSLTLLLEVEQAEQAIDVANYGDNNKLALAGADKWSDPASDPAGDVRAARNAIRAAIGRYPNVMHVSAQAWEAIEGHPAIREQFKYTSSESVTPEMAARYFKVDRLEIGTAVSADEADPAAGFSDVWGNTVVLAYVPPESERDLGVPSYGYTYALDGSPMVEAPYWDDRAKSWVYPTEYERRPYLTSQDAGFLFTGVK